MTLWFIVHSFIQHIFNQCLVDAQNCARIGGKVQNYLRSNDRDGRHHRKLSGESTSKPGIKNG